MVGINACHLFKTRPSSKPIDRASFMKNFSKIDHVTIVSQYVHLKCIVIMNLCEYFGGKWPQIVLILHHIAVNNNSCHKTNFVITDGIIGCSDDNNLWCHQWVVMMATIDFQWRRLWLFWILLTTDLLLSHLSLPTAMPAPYHPATLGQDLVGKSGRDDSEIASVNTKSLVKMRWEDYTLFWSAVYIQNPLLRFKI